MTSTPETIHPVDRRRIGCCGRSMFVLASVLTLSDICLAAKPMGVREGNFACYGEKTEILLTGQQGDANVLLEVPTRYFGDFDIHMEDVRGSFETGSTVPDVWPHCANEPISQTSLQVLLRDPELNLDGTPLSDFPPSSLRLLALSPGPWRLRSGNMHYTEDEKTNLREWFDGLRQQPGKLEEINGFEHMQKDMTSPDSILPEIYFAEPATAEPVSGKPIIFNCQQWTVFNQASANVCQVTYLLPGGVGIYYEFVRQAISHDRWLELDRSMRSFAVALLKDSNLRIKALSQDEQ